MGMTDEQAEVVEWMANDLYNVHADLNESTYDAKAIAEATSPVVIYRSFEEASEVRQSEMMTAARAFAYTICTEDGMVAQ